MKKEIKGLSSSEVTELQSKFGKNTVQMESKSTTLSLLLSQYKNVITGILFVAGAFSYIIGHGIDGFFIFLVLIVNGLFGFMQEYRAQKTMEKLKDLTAPRAFVTRDGKEIEIDARDIVPRDIVVLREGDRVPADGKIITDVQIEVDESILTGESLPVEKKINEELYAGTFLVRGRAYLEVTQVGFATKLGQIAEELGGIEKPKVPLSENLNSLGKRLALVAVLLSLVLVPIGASQGRDLRELIGVAVGVAVALIPEGLPLIVTVALAIGAYRMVKLKAIVRKMAAIETLGSTTVILSDKTGTITQNKMAVKKHWFAAKDDLTLLLRCGILGNTASLAIEEDGGKLAIVGDPTDGAILAFAKTQMNDLESFMAEGKVISEQPFNPETKIIEVQWEDKNVKHTFLRGAPETILKYVGENERKEGEKELKAYASEGLRVIAFAYKNEHRTHKLLGFVGIYDAPRPEAISAIREARDAGIKIVMVTGDNPITAKAIAEDVGMIEEGELVLTHDEIEKLTDDELKKLIPRIRVFARMRPQDKLRLVRIYKKAGHVVAVTGDGVNDALALSEAHIGVAMGGTGTDVAKEASDIIITDDNLATIVRAVEEGRGIYDNIVKVVIFLFSTNLTEFFLILFAILFGFPIPLTPTQILWINLIGDGLPAMALAADTNRKNLLKREPRKITEQILNGSRLRFILVVTFIFSALLIYIFATELQRTGVVPRLLIFNLIVCGEMVILFIIRGGIFPINRFLIFSVLITLVLQYLVSVLPIFKTIFGL